MASGSFQETPDPVSSHNLAVASLFYIYIYTYMYVYNYNVGSWLV